MTDEQPNEVVEEKDQRFLRNIDDSEFYWTFQQVGRVKVIGRVINYLWTSQGVPITLTIETDAGESFEIPWASIQRIYPGKGK